MIAACNYYIMNILDSIIWAALGFVPTYVVLEAAWKTSILKKIGMAAAP